MSLQINHSFPLFFPVNKKQFVIRQLPRLKKHHHFPQLVHCSKTAGKHDQRFRNLSEPQLAHEKIMEIKTQLRADVRIRKLFVRQLNRKSNGLASRFISAAVCCFHDSRPATRTNYESPRSWPQSHRPRSDLVGELSALFVVA